MFRMFSRTGAHQKRAPALRRMSNNSATFSGLYVHGMLLLLNGLFGAARHSLVKGGGGFYALLLNLSVLATGIVVQFSIDRLTVCGQSSENLCEAQHVQSGLYLAL